MSKKTRSKKMRLGKKLKQSRRIPHIARLRTHGRLQFNRFKRDWRKQKMGLEE
jgi:ribosomal protein L39E